MLRQIKRQLLLKGKLYFGLLMLNGVFAINAANASLEFWDVVSAANAAVVVEQSNDAQEGEQLLLIDGTAIDLSDVVREDPVQPEGVVVQTVEVDDLIGKHLHISGFAKSYEPDFSLLKKQFDDVIKKELEFYRKAYGELYDEGSPLPFGSVESYREKFSDWLKRSNSNADYGIFVLLHIRAYGQEKSIRKHIPTSRGKGSVGQWNRFNIEVSIPENCTALSLVLWSRGVNKVAFDHVAVVDQGVDSNVGSDQGLIGDSYSLGDRLIEYFEAGSSDAYEKIRNLSFE